MKFHPNYLLLLAAIPLAVTACSTESDGRIEIRSDDYFYIGAGHGPYPRTGSHHASIRLDRDQHANADGSYSRTPEGKLDFIITFKGWGLSYGALIKSYTSVDLGGGYRRYTSGLIEPSFPNHGEMRIIADLKGRDVVRVIAWELSPPRYSEFNDPKSWPRKLFIFHGDGYDFGGQD